MSASVGCCVCVGRSPGRLVEIVQHTERRGFIRIVARELDGQRVIAIRNNIRRPCSVCGECSEVLYFKSPKA